MINQKKNIIANELNLAVFLFNFNQQIMSLREDNTSQPPLDIYIDTYEYASAGVHILVVMRVCVVLTVREISAGLIAIRDTTTYLFISQSTVLLYYS